MKPIIGLQIIGTPPIPPLGHPAVVKFVEPNLDYVRKVREMVGPDTVFIHRWDEGTQPLDHPFQRAEEWYDRHFTAMIELDHLGPCAFEGYNEIGREQALAYAAFEYYRLDMMNEADLAGVAFNFSVGRPAVEEWCFYETVLDLLRHSRHYLGLHVYWSDHEDLRNRWHVWRHRLPEVAPLLKDISILFTEAGRDFIWDQGLPEYRWGRPGWQLSATADEFIAELEELGDLCDDAVKGVTVFQYGSNDPRWGSFDVAPIWERVVQAYQYDNPIVIPDPSLAVMTTDARWQVEEATRKVEAGQTAEALDILHRIVNVDTGLMYQIERRAKDEGL